MTKNGCAAEIKIIKLYASHFTSGPDGDKFAKQMATAIIPDRSEGIVTEFPRIQSSTSPVTISLLIVIIVLFL